MSSEQRRTGDSTLRYILGCGLLLLSLYAAGHFAWLYGKRHLYMGLLCSLSLGALVVTGAMSFFRARTKVEWELAAFLGDSGSKTPDSLLARRSKELQALRERGGRPDLAALASKASAEIEGQAYLGRYFVTISVLIGLLGTFAGLMETLSGVSQLLREETGQTVKSVLLLLTVPLSGLDVTFGASMVGILAAVSLALLQGDLALSEERLLSTLELHTAHVLVPSLWPRSQEEPALAIQELSALRGEVRALLTSVHTWQVGSQEVLATHTERSSQALAAASESGLHTLSLSAERTAEALTKQGLLLSDQLDSRIRQLGDVLVAQSRRSSSIVEQATQQLAQDVSAALQKTLLAAEKTLSMGVSRSSEAAEQVGKAFLSTVGRLEESASSACTEAFALSKQAVQEAAEKSTLGSLRAVEQVVASMSGASASLVSSAEALSKAEMERAKVLVEAEIRRQEEHEALRERLSAFLEQGIASPIQEAIATWTKAAHVVDRASQELAGGAKALLDGATQFALGTETMAPHLHSLAPELHALSSEVALLLGRATTTEGGALLVSELMRLTDVLNRLETQLTAPPPEEAGTVEHTPQNGAA